MKIPIRTRACFKEYQMQRQVEERYEKWMREHWAAGAKEKFEWTDENVIKLFAFADAIIEKENRLYKLLSDVKADIESLLASGKSYYAAYDINAYLSYEADSYATPTGDEETMLAVYCCTDFHSCMGLYTAAGKPLGTQGQEFGRDTNYNYGFPFSTFPEREYFIARSLHRLMQQRTYTIEDFLCLNPDNFVECIEVRN